MEFERKLAADTAETLDQILTHEAIRQAICQPMVEIPMETVYYGDRDGILSAHRWTLRRRMEGKVSVVTCKTPGDGPYCRGEWELHADDLVAALPQLIAAGAPRELLNLQDLHPICGAKFIRRALLLDLHTCKVELALDLGKLFRDDRVGPICEVELELKDGDPAAMLELGDQLCAAYSLHDEPKSKFCRASQL